MRWEGARGGGGWDELGKGAVSGVEEVRCKSESCLKPSHPPSLLPFNHPSILPRFLFPSLQPSLPPTPALCSRFLLVTLAYTWRTNLHKHADLDCRVSAAGEGSESRYQPVCRSRWKPHTPPSPESSETLHSLPPHVARCASGVHTCGCSRPSRQNIPLAHRTHRWRRAGQTPGSPCRGCLDPNGTFRGKVPFHLLRFRRSWPRYIFFCFRIASAGSCCAHDQLYTNITLEIEN